MSKPADKYTENLPRWEEYVIIKHGLWANDVMANLYHRIDENSPWDGCYQATITWLDGNTIAVLVPEPEYEHKIVVYG